MKAAKLIRSLCAVLLGLWSLEGIADAAPKGDYTRIKGVVTDSLTHEKLPYVTVTLPKAQRAVLSDDSGKYSIYSSVPTDTISFSYVGYRPVKVPVKHIYEGILNVKMVPQDYVLQELLVKPKKQKYSKKDNPAVELMETIRRNRDLNNPRQEPFYEYDRYEKLTLAVNDVSLEEAKKGINKRFNFALEFIDTARFTGKPILNLSVREKASRMMNRKNPGSRKEVVTGIRSVGIEENFDQENMQKIMEDVFRDIDIYQNDITLMQNRFVSPLSKIGADYYKYYITDTVADEETGTKLIELTFAPHNPQSFSFNGKLYVDYQDTARFVRKVKMQVPRAINLNFVENIFVEQKFEKDSIGNRHKVLDDMVVEFKVIPGLPEIYARRLAVAGNFTYIPDEQFSFFYDLEGNKYTLKKALSQDESFWKTGDYIPSLTNKESRMGEFMKKLRGVPLYYYGEKFVRLMAFGYFKVGRPSVFDIGPINTMLSFNDVEGTRLRLGGKTTANLSPHWFTRFYGAYGIKDHRWKYMGELEYSFLPKKYHSREFPVHSLRLTHEYDLDMIGQHYLFTNADNIFLSLKRAENTKMTYRRFTELEYTQERHSGFSFNLRLRHEIQYATRWLPFVNGLGETHNSFTQAAFRVKLRYAPGETFYQMQSERLPINMDSWILQLTHEYGPKGMLGSDFTLNKTEVSVQKRFWFSAFGYLDAIVKAGKIWSQVPYTALSWANANLSYTIQPESFALMLPMEFATDQYATADLTYWMNGLIFNRIPYFNRAKLREVVSFRAYWGNLTEKNDPSLHPELYRFPVDAAVGKLGKVPYMEIGVGLDNIFKILRLDYVWRLSYRDVPGVDKSGLRVQLHFTF